MIRGKKIGDMNVRVVLAQSNQGKQVGTALGKGFGAEKVECFPRKEKEQM
jgi:hypothetical protein